MVSHTLLQASYHCIELSIIYCVIIPCTCLTINTFHVVFQICFSTSFPP